MKVVRRVGFGAIFGLAYLAGAWSAQANTYTPIDFTSGGVTGTGGNIQSNLISTFPTGSYTPGGNSFGANFSIPTTGNNFDAGSVTINTNISNVTDVFTLLNAYSPVNGQTLGTIQFLGTGGASDTFSLVAGTNIRDFYQGSFANGIDGTTTQNAFSCNDPSNCLGAGGTGNVNTGQQGNYVIDEQDFTLNSSFIGQTLTQIILTEASGGNGTPILLGITAADITPSATPLPAALPLFAGGLGLLSFMSRRRKREHRIA